MKVFLLGLFVLTMTACKATEFKNDSMSDGNSDAVGQSPQPALPVTKVILEKEDLRFLVVAHSGPNPSGIRWVLLRATPNGPHPVDYGKICSYKIDGVTDFTGYVPVWEGTPTTEPASNFPEIVGTLEGVARPNWWATDVFGLYTPTVDYGVAVAYSTSGSNPILTSLECNRL